MLSWVVSTVAHSRNEFGLIDMDRPVKRLRVAPEFTAHLVPLLSTDAYTQLDGLMQRFERHELSLGDLANRGETERRLALQLGSLPEQVAARVSDAQTGIAQTAADKVESVMADRAAADEERNAAQAKIDTFKRLRGIFGPIYDMFEGAQLSEQDAERIKPFLNDPDPILSYVACEAGEDDDSFENGPTGLQRYRELRGEVQRANAVSDPRTCERCISEGITHTEVVCVHALMGQKPQQRSCFDPICSGWRAQPLPPNAGLAPPLTESAPLQPLSDPSNVTTLSLPATSASDSHLAVVGVKPSSAPPSPPSLPPLPPNLPQPLSGLPPAGLLLPPPSDDSLSPTAVPPPEIGSEAWTQLPDEKRHSELRALFNAVSLNNLQVSGVRGMLQQYLRRIAPLERLPAKRGYEWRGTRYAGAVLKGSFTQLLTKWYNPILCRVLEYMDENAGISIWAAADAVEARRTELGTFEKLRPDFSHFLGNEAARVPFMKRLHDPEFATASLALLAPPPPPPPSDVVEVEVAVTDSQACDSLLSIPALENATTRILGLDPAISSGFSVIQLDSAGGILSISVGVLDVSDKSLASDGARCNDLQRQLRPLLTPPPDRVYVESFFGHGRQCDAISYMLRAAIAMELAANEIDRVEVAPQSWKKTVAHGNADKAAVKSAIEERMDFRFPVSLFIRGRWLKFRDDASDATGIALHGVAQLHGSISFAESFLVEAPGLPKARPGRVIETSPAAPSSPSATVEAVEAAPSTPVQPERVLHDPWACTLNKGCILRCNHTGICQFGEAALAVRPGRGTKRLHDSL